MRPLATLPVLVALCSVAPSASSSNVPPYDFAADLRLRTQLARTHVGPDAEIRVVGNVFLFVAGDDGFTFEPSVRLADQALAALFNGRFSTYPEQAVTVYVFDARGPYDDLCRARYGSPCDSPYGLYNEHTREIVSDQSFGNTTIVHELVHPLIEADFPRAPRWLNEGIASLFERPDLRRPGEIHGMTNWRLPRLQQALASPREREAARLDALFRTPDDLFEGDEDVRRRAYAVARYACQWLDSQGRLWRFYRTWRDHVGDDPTGEKAFTQVVGQSPAEATAAWQAWVRTLRL